MSSLTQDIRFGFRMLWKYPSVTIFAVLALAIGIGANTALFSLIYNVLLSPLPFAEPEEIMWIQSRWSSGDRGTCSGPDYLDWVEQNTVFENLAAMNMDCHFSLTGLGEPKALVGVEVSTNFFTATLDKMTLGRSFLPEESQSGNRVIVLSHKLWQNLFDSDKDIINQKIIINEEPHTVVGVAPPMMGFIEEMAQVYTTLRIDKLQQNRSSHFYGIIGRLNDGVSLQQALAEMNMIASRLSELYPDSNTNKGIAIRPLQEMLVEEVRTAFLVLYGAVGFLLLIACVNVANLLLAKASSRNKEIAIRSALGAGRFRIFRQVITESVILSIMGGCLGLMFALWGLDALRYLAPHGIETGSTGIPGFDEIGIDSTILIFTLILSMISGLLFGAVPAWQISKTKINETLKDSGRGTSFGSSRHRLLNGLVVSEVALALIILMGAGLLIKSFYNLQQIKPGFDANHVLAAHMELPDSERNQDSKVRVSFYNKLINNVSTLPGVKSVAAINVHPLTPSNSNNGFHFEGKPLPPGQGTSAEYRSISNEYFPTMGIPLIKGRYFNQSDTAESKPVVIVNQEFVDRFTPNEEPLGRRIRLNGELQEIIGVVGNVKLRALNAIGFNPFMYKNMNQDSRRMMTLMVKTKGDPMALAPALRREIWDVDPNQPILWIQSMNNVVNASISVQRFCMILLSVMAVVAFLLAIIGIYSVMSFAVQERTHEIGIRMTLGAQVHNIIFLIVRKGFILTIIGLIIGLFGSYAVTRLMAGMLYQMTATDPLTFIIVPLILLGIALLACYLPAWRAAKTDPMIILRSE